MGFSLGRSISFRSKLLSSSAGFTLESLFANGEQGAWYDPSDLSTLFTDTAGTTQATVGDDVARNDDKSDNDNHATQPVLAKRLLLQQDGSYYLDPDLVDDEMPFTLPGSYSGGRAFANRHGHQIDASVPLAGFEQVLPNVQLSEWIGREGAFTATEIDKISERMPGDRQYMVCLTSDLTLSNLRMNMSNAEAPVVRAIGANGAEATVALGDDSDSTLDLDAAGLTSPATVLFPIVTDPTALERFYCHNNNLTGSIPDLSANTALVLFYCHRNNLTGSIPDLSANTALKRFYCYNNNLTGSIPDLSANTALQFFHCSRNNLTGSIPDLSAKTALRFFHCHNNNLTGWSGGTLPASLTDFRADDNDFPEATVDALLQALDAAGASNGNCDLEGGTNAAPSANGETAIDNLRNRGWTVTVTGGY